MRTILILIGLSCALAAAQQNSGGWSELRSRNPLQLEFSIRLLNQCAYHEGELIRAEVKYPPPHFLPGKEPPPEQWQFAGYLLNPERGCGSPEKPCFGFADPAGGIGVGSGGSSGSGPVFLNRYLRELPPGRYRTAVLARKLVLTSRAPMSATYAYTTPAQYAVSNDVEFEVIAAPPVWIKQTIDASVAKLKEPQPGSREGYEARTAAAQQLRFLDQPAAWTASLDLLPAEEGTLLSGLSATREPKRVCELMQSRIAAPEQAVSLQYLSTLAGLCSRASLPPPPTSEDTRQKYWIDWHNYQERILEGSISTLAASLPRKQAGGKTIAIEALLQRIQQRRSIDPQGPAPDWIPVLRQEFIKSFPELESWRKHHLLTMYAAALKGPELIPLAESMIDAWKPSDYYESPRSALHVLHALDSVRAEKRILAEVVKPKTWLDTPQLDLLPAGAVPPMDDELIEALAAAQCEGGWNLPLRMAALAKYATPQALPRIQAIYESQQVSCQPELMAYFLRVEPAYADRVFRSHQWDMRAAPPLCILQYFERTPRLAMHTVLERYMAAYLMHRDVLVKKTAAQSLGLYGSQDALFPLWEAFRYFHEYWKGKQAELEQNKEGIFLEVELRNAIARGRGWLATETDLHTIESLCISERCVYETRQDLQNVQEPFRIEITGSGFGGLQTRIAQYCGLTSIEQVKAKLAQFPPGTRFVLAAYGSDADNMSAEIRKYAAGRRLVIVRGRPDMLSP
ncbi:MAG: hypothetical protein HUU41_02450 [Bryobacteraceae bacterium]|nr:hypothetical protein [Bryobacterales bacterium]MEB2363642.1 hypothetical protein [Bryobacterales bacterium]NUM99950.1 hypothetical protein [Bryobacteraceae bacterium]